MKIISANTKTDVKQEIKELVAPSSLILPVKNRGWGEKVFTSQPNSFMHDKSYLLTITLWLAAFT